MLVGRPAGRRGVSVRRHAAPDASLLRPMPNKCPKRAEGGHTSRVRGSPFSVRSAVSVICRVSVRARAGAVAAVTGDAPIPARHRSPISRRTSPQLGYSSRRRSSPALWMSPGRAPGHTVGRVKERLHMPGELRCSSSIWSGSSESSRRTGCASWKTTVTERIDIQKGEARAILVRRPCQWQGSSLSPRLVRRRASIARRRSRRISRTCKWWTGHRSATGPLTGNGEERDRRGANGDARSATGTIRAMGRSRSVTSTSAPRPTSRRCLER